MTPATRTDRTTTDPCATSGARASTRPSWMRSAALTLLLLGALMLAACGSAAGQAEVLDENDLQETEVADGDSFQPDCRTSPERRPC